MRDDNDDEKHFRRRPLLRYATGLICVAMVPFAASIFVTSYAVVLVIAGMALLLAAFATVVYHELT